MKSNAFEELLASVSEAGAFLRGEEAPSRRATFDSADVRVIRERTNLSQAEFAALMGVSVKTLQNWEQHRRRPTGPAAALLRVMKCAPELVIRAIHGS